MRRPLFGTVVLLVALLVLGAPDPASAETKLAILEVRGMVCPS
jgi:hypothetical protein